VIIVGLIGERLKSLRSKKGLKQQDIADILGIQRGSYGNYENDSRIPSIDQLVKLSDLFEVSLDYLVKGEYSIPNYTIQDEIIRMVPVIKSIAEAQDLDKNVHYLSPAIIPYDKPDQYFYFDIVEDHMVSSRIEKGDRILFHKQCCIESGQIGLFLVKGSYIVLGSIEQYSDISIVKPVNGSYKVLIFDNKTKNDLKVLGQALYGNYDLSLVESCNCDIKEMDHTPKERDEHDPLEERFNSVLDGI
jgi:transcriptional regulator with XRE-family HTH domain